jgi:CheY-like chemotaxis protein
VPLTSSTPPDPADKVDILVVDDLQEKLLVFKTVLEDLGQNLVFVRSGAEALKEVLRREFAVILLDVNMPDIDGLETATLIRRYKKSAHTPIIFITAYADEMQTNRGYELGAVDYILSPVVPEVLPARCACSSSCTCCSGASRARPTCASRTPPRRRRCWWPRKASAAPPICRT